MDNAGNCNTTAMELQNLLPTFCGAAGRTRCFLHIINLIAKVSSHGLSMLMRAHKPINNRLLFHFS
ncbi:hypothetical protein PAXRUDRAFT_171923 [Paxillus rubicundulus Ve08.2h10]|uniref:Uncharacterized protein n=1 Tax=Paxillus rubicundulus Ve08.2h10 TaxID=930991 RepID=A0A0D0CX57_9AGAM|nr:hypothetical protein PAXRUDRAFT_171923 [Paxillus rubicundulus Ve08.2h10]